MSDGSESLHVAMRVRPFNAKEKERNCTCCVRMKDDTTTVIHPDTKQEKTFTFDYSYWSHDGDISRGDGFRISAGPGKGTGGATYADQLTVYKGVGHGILDSAFEGFNSCLFAYGQTGSGKSYSMFGYGVNKGVVPMACEEIFKRIQARRQQ